MSNHSIFTTPFRSKEDLDALLRQDPSLYRKYWNFPRQLKQQLDNYLLGKATLPFIYDTFFKMVFSPDVHPDRLSRLLSSILGMELKAVKILPNESTILTTDGSILILDIIVELADGSLANVEIQKIPFKFPAERLSCYSADLVLRQYSRVRGERGNLFQYSDLHKVYTVVIYEKSPAPLQSLSDVYIHLGTTKFNTGLNLELLQEYYLVALDIFRKFHYDKEEASELKGWLSFLCTSSVSEAEKLVGKYPWLEEIYRESAGMCQNVEEVLSVWSEALQILDRNGMQLMIDEMKEQIDGLASQNSALKAALKEQSEADQARMAEMQKELESLRAAARK